MPPAKKENAATTKTTAAAKKSTTKASTTKKPTTQRRTTATKKTTSTTKTLSAKAQVADNAKHIEENRKEIAANTTMIHALYGIIILLLVIVAGLAFYIGTMTGKTQVPHQNTVQNTPVAQNTVQNTDIEILVIDDARCSDCQTSTIVSQLKTLPFLAGASFNEIDFSDQEAKTYLENNNITVLPAVVFNTNSLADGGQITPFLQELPNGEYSLALGAKFDPYAARSDKGFLTLEKDVIEDLLEGSYIDGNPNAAITWIEYSDIECPFCARLHNEGTQDTIKDSFGEDINIVFQHFPLDFHPQALPGAQALECIAEQNSEAFYSVISESFKKYSSNNFSLSGFYDIAEDAGINKQALESCVENDTYKDKVLAQMSLGQETFGITGTPGNVIINTQTGEYEIVSGAYPASTFESIISRMLEE